MSRWEELFDDLEGRIEEDERAEALGSVPDRVRRDRGVVTLEDRLHAVTGATVRFGLRGGLVVDGVVDDVGAGWCEVVQAGRPVVLTLHAVVSVDGLDRRARPDEAADRHRIGAPLRGLLRDRRPVRIHDVDGVVREGLLDGVGADHVDLLVLPSDMALRRRDGVRCLVLSLTSVAAVAQV